jgi:hypothetical protein
MKEGHMGDLSEDGRIILKWVLRKRREIVYFGFKCYGKSSHETFIRVHDVSSQVSNIGDSDVVVKVNLSKTVTQVWNLDVFILLYYKLPRFRCKYIKIDLQEIGCECMAWINLAQDRVQWRVLVNIVMNPRVP